MKRNGSPSTSFTIHLHTHIYEITFRNRGVPFFNRVCTREGLFLDQIYSFPSMLFIVTGSHVFPVSNR